MHILPFVLLGFLGGVHCVGMCGPLALALPAANGNRTHFLAGRLAYNGGRVITYTLIGGLFGSVGQIASLAGLQRWVSILAGIALWVGLAAPARMNSASFIARMVGWLKSPLTTLLKQRSYLSLLSLGLLNGLLPCGLVYVAAASAAVSGNFWRGMEQMFAFGLSTIPIMLTVSWVGGSFIRKFGFNPRRLIPVTAGVVGALLIVRGLASGIPYLDLLTDSLCGVEGAAHLH